ncbi:hypothetical protein [Pontibacter russatus]|uniref:hypothetical protein n=1 Tax=Pontibacter russatus TaxID=2694929 RepID=UPI00137B0FAA|nr:hypothetical protein [Pontibacter russatus]
MTAQGERRLYGDADLIAQQLASMRLMESSAGDYAAVYKDPVTGAFWLRYYATAAAQGGGYLTLMRLPAPTIAALIDIAITTRFKDEAVAAMLRLLDEEAIEKKDFRELLVEKLERHQPESKQQKQRLIQLIKLTGLDDPMNRREVLQRSRRQVEQDSAYFKAVAGRATHLLRKLQA